MNLTIKIVFQMKFKRSKPIKMKNNTNTLFNKISFLEALFIVFLILIAGKCSSQEIIDPYTVWYDYKLKMPTKISYTVIRPIVDVKRTGVFRGSKLTSQPNWYKGSGYDKGHLFPANLTNNNKQMYNSFNMKNVVPMNPSLNRGIWRSIELRVENLAKQYDSIKVEIQVWGIKEVIGQLNVPKNFSKELWMYKDGKLIDMELFVIENKKPEFSNLMFYLVK